MLALRRVTFLYALAVARPPRSLLRRGPAQLEGFAVVVLALQAVGRRVRARPRARGGRGRGGEPRVSRRGRGLAAAAGVEGWLTEAQARRLWARARGGAPARRGRRDRLVPRALGDRARARRGGRGRGDRPARGRRPRARRRSRPTRRAARRTRGVPGEPRPRGRRRPRSPRAAAVARTRWASVDGPSSCCTSTAPTASGRRAPTSPAGAPACAPGGAMLVHDAFSSSASRSRCCAGARLAAVALRGPRRHRSPSTAPGRAAARRARVPQRRAPARRAAVVRAQRGDQGAGGGAGCAPLAPRLGPAAGASGRTERTRASGEHEQDHRGDRDPVHGDPLAARTRSCSRRGRGPGRAGEHRHDDEQQRAGGRHQRPAPIRATGSANAPSAITARARAANTKPSAAPAASAASARAAARHPARRVGAPGRSAARRRAAAGGRRNASRSSSTSSTGADTA